MAIKYFTGFEMNDTTELAQAAGSGTIQVQATTRKSGDRALRTYAATTALAYGYVAMPAATGALSSGNFSIANVYVSFDFLYSIKPAANSEPFSTLHDGAAVKFELRLTSEGLISTHDASGTLLNTGTTVLSPDTWYRIDYTCGTGTNAAIGVRINGQPEDALTTTSSNVSSTNTNRVYLGKLTNRNSQTVEWFFDNLFVDDAAYAPTNALVLRLDPAGDGTYTAWTGADTDWSNLTETTLSTDTTYLTSTLTSGDATTATFESCASAGVSGTTLGTIYRLAMQRDGASSGTFAGRLRRATTNYDTSNTNSGSTIAAFARPYLTDPSTTEAWTTAGLDAIEVGVVEKHATLASRFYSTHVMVAMTPAAGGGLSLSLSELIWQGTF